MIADEQRPAGGRNSLLACVGSQGERTVWGRLCLHFMYGTDQNILVNIQLSCEFGGDKMLLYVLDGE